MQILITRHGETEDNINNILSGHNPGILTKKGEEQAKKLGKRLQIEPIDYIYSSDLARSIDTANIIKTYIAPTILIRYSELLRERDFAGISVPKKKDNAGLTFTNIKGCESPNIFFGRLKKSTQDIVQKHSHDETILIVAHGSANRLIIASLLGYTTLEEAKQIPSQNNTALNIIKIDSNNIAQAVLLNCTQHLS